MSVPLVDLKAQYRSMKDELDRAVQEVIESQYFVLGPTVQSFEEEAAAYVGTKHAIGCASGTDALLLPLRAFAFETGSEVIVPSFTFFATAGAVWNAGLRPVFADIDPVTYTITAETVRSLITPRTRAIIPVHLYGQMAQLDPLRALASEYGLKLIEDAAQAFGARQRVDGEWRQAGSVGDVGCHSFFPAKILGAYGDGGMVVTDDDELADRLRQLRVHGGHRTYYHERVGTNSRLDAIQAAVLRTKLPRVPGWLEARRANAERYEHLFRHAGLDVKTPRTLDENEHAFNVYTVRVEGRDALKKHLDEAGIGNAVYYPLGLHMQECFRELGYDRGDLPVTEAACEEVISLPIYPELTEQQQEEVVAAVRGAFAPAG